MNVIQSIALGVLQGATEFLPVSSSGHLVVARELFGVGEIPVLFDVLLHAATLVAVIIVLRRQVTAFLRALVRFFGRSVTEEDRPYVRLIPMIIVTTAITEVSVSPWMHPSISAIPGLHRCSFWSPPRF